MSSTESIETSLQSILDLSENVLHQVGYASDVIIVSPISSSSSDPKERSIHASSDFIVQFPGLNSQHIIQIQINGRLIDESILTMKSTSSSSDMCVFTQGLATKPSTEILKELVEQCYIHSGKNLLRYILVDKSSSRCNCKPRATSLHTKQGYRTIGVADANLFLWSSNDRIIISDIDGTITKSDIRGVIDSIITENYVHVHNGVCEFFSCLAASTSSCFEDRNKLHDSVTNSHDNIVHCDSDAPGEVSESSSCCDASLNELLHDTSHDMLEENNDDRTIEKKTPAETEEEKIHQKHHEEVTKKSNRNIRMLYLTSRPLRLVRSTRKFLHQLCQREYSMPHGPIFLHSGSLADVLVTELVHKSTHEFKADLLTRQVILPFVAAGHQQMVSNDTHDDLLLAGFGNKETDAKAYEMVGIPKSNIFIIDRKSRIVSTQQNQQKGEDIASCYYDEDSSCYNEQQPGNLILCPMSPLSMFAYNSNNHNDDNGEGNHLQSNDDRSAISNTQDKNVESNSIEKHQDIVSVTTKPSNSRYCVGKKREFSGYDDPTLKEVLLERIENTYNLMR